MTESETTLDLSSIGRELDLARRSRSRTTTTTTTTASGLVTVPEDGAVSDSDSASSSSPLVTRPPLPSISDDEEQLPPTCLLCFTRPPSAVLLPCCHLNLCYLCAPLLLLKQCRAPPPISTPTTAVSPPKTPFNIALRQAMINHPKSRRLSGGNIPPPTGDQDKELKAEDVVASCDPERKEGLRGEKGDDGRIELGICEEARSEGRCLVCRAGVSGWLRVYTG